MMINSVFGIRRDEKPAVTAYDGTVSYKELEVASGMIAAALARRGVPPGGRVAVMLSRSWKAVAAILGIWTARAVFVPVDPAVPAARLRRILHMADVHLLISDVAAGSPEIPAVHIDQLMKREGKPEEAKRNCLPSDSAYVIFTSGSTGTPKGVVISNSNLAGYCRALREFLDPEEGATWGSVSPLWTDLGHTAIFGALTSGGCLYLVDEETYTSSHRFAEICQRIDYLKVTPTHMSALFGDGYAGVLPSKALILGGEPCPGQLVAHIREAAPGLDIINHYGPAECTVGAAAYRVPSGPWPPERHHVPVGKGLPGIQVTVRDCRGNEVPPGTPGEVWVRGETVGGYLERSDSGNFVDRELSVPAYRTGDRGVEDDAGQIVIRGRLDRQLKVHGMRVDPSEVEAVLVRFPGVRDAAVLGVRGIGDALELAAVVVTEPKPTVTVQDMREFVQGQLPEFMVPRRVMCRRDLPFKANGKLDETLLARELEGKSL